MLCMHKASVALQSVPDVWGGVWFTLLLLVIARHHENRTNTRQPPFTVIGVFVSPLNDQSDGSVWRLLSSGHLLTVTSS